eukprot:COSAG01_NODE_7332_length_3247_cov_2.094663_6_plen_127_part_00
MLSFPLHRQRPTVDEHLPQKNRPWSGQPGPPSAAVLSLLGSRPIRWSAPKLDIVKAGRFCRLSGAPWLAHQAGAGVGCVDRADQGVLGTRKGQRRAVVVLGLLHLMEPCKDQGHIRFGGGRHSFFE